VRKVSRATTKNQKKERKLNKKLMIIWSVIILIAIGVGVGLGVYYGTKDKDTTYVSDKIYFNEPTKDTAGHEVVFNKDNYQAIQRYIKDGLRDKDGNKNNLEDIFIFVYDGTAYYADEKDEDNYNEDYVKLITRLADLQYQVDQAKAAGLSIELYVVDVSVDLATNVDILMDSQFGGFYSDDEGFYEPAFIFIKGDQFKSKVEYADESHVISTSDWTDVLSSSILYAINYIDYLKTTV
ncbi:hypothetical protein HDR67_02680, partial [bacterium]|nr:hypothetical protein [bacterium]